MVGRWRGCNGCAVGMIWLFSAWHHPPHYYAKDFKTNDLDTSTMSDRSRKHMIILRLVCKDFIPLKLASSANADEANRSLKLLCCPLCLLYGSCQATDPLFRGGKWESPWAKARMTPFDNTSASTSSTPKIAYRRRGYAKNSVSLPRRRVMFFSSHSQTTSDFQPSVSAFAGVVAAVSVGPRSPWVHGAPRWWPRHRWQNLHRSSRLSFLEASRCIPPRSFVQRLPYEDHIH